ncbi:MAG: glycosyltransferase family 2 protein, partial [Pyrinomonadaceae bacterium]
MIDILLSTFNGAGFIEAQLDSILGQGFREFRLIARDDGSTDSTLKILGHYRDVDERVQILRDDLGNIGSSRSFLRLLELSDADFFMFADQDDVWLPGKIAASIVKIEDLGKDQEKELPLLVFTDLVVCDGNLDEIETSLWKYQHLDPAICFSWRRLLAQNVVTGCTMLGNAAARRVSLPYVLDEMFHDHWIAVNVARSGMVDFLREPTVLYRQHSDNTEGAKNFGYRYASQRLSDPGGRYSFYRKAGEYFGISANRILLQKIVESIRRFI